MQSYEIISFDKSNGTLTVSFNNNTQSINIDIPLDEEGKYITGTELDAYIQGFIPTWHLERLAKISAGIPNQTEIEALVKPLPPANNVVETPQSPQPLQPSDLTTEQWQEYESEKLIAKALIKWGVIKEDPTAIPQTTA